MICASFVVVTVAGMIAGWTTGWVRLVRVEEVDREGWHLEIGDPDHRDP